MNILKVTFLDGQSIEVEAETTSQAIAFAAYERAKDGAISYKELTFWMVEKANGQGQQVSTKEIIDKAREESVDIIEGALSTFTDETGLVVDDVYISSFELAQNGERKEIIYEGTELKLRA